MQLTMGNGVFVFLRKNAKKHAISCWFANFAVILQSNGKEETIYIQSLDSHDERVAVYGDGPSSPHGSYMYGCGAMPGRWQFQR